MGKDDHQANGNLFAVCMENNQVLTHVYEPTIVGNLFCPYCGEKLIAHESLDIWMVELSCLNKHRLFLPLKSSSAVLTAQAKHLDLKNHSDSTDSAFLVAWLDNEDMRSRLNEQLAQIIRSVLDQKSGNSFLQSELIKYCLLCKHLLIAAKSSDGWSTGKKCLNEHTFFGRDNSVMFQVNNGMYRLFTAFNVEQFDALLHAWSSSPYLDAQTNPRLKDILVEFKKSYSKDP